MLPPSIALLSWPLLAFLLFKYLPRNAAIIWGTILPFMFLPPNVAIDLKALPPLGRHQIASITIMVFLAADFTRRYVEFPWRRHGYAFALFLLVGVIGTTVSNGDPITFPRDVVPGLSLFDFAGSYVGLLISLIPFLLGLIYLSNIESLRLMVYCIFIAGLVYSVFVLVEARLSPQFNNWVYGYFPHSFAQHIRGAGFRPVVFQPHGLWLAFFMAICTAAAGVMWRRSAGRTGRDATTEGRAERLGVLLILYMCVVLVLCRSLAAQFYGLILLSAVLFLNVRLQLWIALAVTMFAATYPVLRSLGFVPIEFLLQIAYSISLERGASLEFRFIQEGILLEKAMERPVFGWGGWGRNRVYDEISGQDVSITDGYWVIIFGQRGVFGYLYLFGLLSVPAILLFFKRKRVTDLSVAFLAMVVAINLLELLPNSTLPPFTWLIAGALTGYALKLQPAPEPEPDTAPPDRPVGKPRTVL